MAVMYAHPKANAPSARTRSRMRPAIRASLPKLSPLLAVVALDPAPGRAVHRGRLFRPERDVDDLVARVRDAPRRVDLGERRRIELVHLRGHAVGDHDVA